MKTQQKNKDNNVKVKETMDEISVIQEQMKTLTKERREKYRAV